MKNRKSNKNVVIIMLIVLLLALAVGYAAFVDVLNISGTANTKGTLDLEFQNAEVVKIVGANTETTKAEISVDKNMLIVNAGDLSYPGAGVEYSVDIVNVGTMPAEIQAITPTNITGSDKIKVNGLDVIKTDHPKIEKGKRCNIHFTVEWPIDVGEIPENESSISFGLQIEYTQSTGENFEAEVSHTDSDKDGNIIRTDKIGTNLTEIIEPKDYGKSINYKATVKGQEVNNWKVLYNDKSNVYIILDDYLPNNLVPVDTGLDINGTYAVYSNTSREVLLDRLTTEKYWSEFSSGIEGATATGTPTYEIFMKSYNETYGTTIDTDPKYNEGLSFLIDKTNSLYVPHTSTYNEVNGYWFASINTNISTRLWNVNYNGGMSGNDYNSKSTAIRPVVCLPSDITGTVGDTVEIK